MASSFSTPLFCPADLIFLSDLSRLKIRRAKKFEVSDCFFVGYFNFFWPFLFWNGFSDVAKSGLSVLEFYFILLLSYKLGITIFFWNLLFKNGICILLPYFVLNHNTSLILNCLFIQNFRILWCSKGRLGDVEASCRSLATLSQFLAAIFTSAIWLLKENRKVIKRGC